MASADQPLSSHLYEECPWSRGLPVWRAHQNLHIQMWVRLLKAIFQEPEWQLLWLLQEPRSEALCFQISSGVKTFHLSRGNGIIWKSSVSLSHWVNQASQYCPPPNPNSLMSPTVHCPGHQAQNPGKGFLLPHLPTSNWDDKRTYCPNQDTYESERKHF